MEGWQEVDIYFVLYAGTSGMLLLCFGMLLFLRGYSKRLLAEQEEKNRMELDYKDKLLYSHIQATENERARIARDLHDEVGASLSLLRMKVTTPDAKPIIDSTIDNVRRISYDLLPPTLGVFGIAVALQAFFEKIEHNIAIHFQVIDEHLRFDTVTELSIYRVVQELVQNTFKHSGADKIDFVMEYKNDQLAIIYHDNGKGYDYGSQQKENGLGMKNIAFRIKQCGGTLQYKRRIDNSIEVHISIPQLQITHHEHNAHSISR